MGIMQNTQIHPVGRVENFDLKRNDIHEYSNPSGFQRVGLENTFSMYIIIIYIS
jgi:hypothetical protein